MATEWPPDPDISEWISLCVIAGNFLNGVYNDKGALLFKDGKLNGTSVQ